MNTSQSLQMDPRFDFVLTPEETAYVEPILEMAANRKKAKRVETLSEWVARWHTFAENMGAYAHHFEEFANEDSVREILERDVMHSAPATLQRKLRASLKPADDLYKAKTAPLSQAWFGKERLGSWWWTRCPSHWQWHMQFQLDEDEWLERHPEATAP
jgi:hypothetical protein